MFKTVSANLFGNRRMIQSENYPMIAKTLASLEDVLAEELIALEPTMWK
jgi:hypothetical protein